MPAKKTTTTSMIYQRKITLKDSKPPIWRRIQVKDDTTLYTLHQIIQIAMGWTNPIQSTVSTWSTKNEAGSRRSCVT